MKTTLTNIAGIALACALFADTAAAQTKEISVKTMPASVIKTVPASGATDVDPALKELTFTFSKDMTTTSWSVCQISAEHFPESDGKIKFLPDKRTCVMPVKLEPGKTYVLWLNRGQFQAFRDADKNPSVPYLLVFQTKSQ